MSEDILLRATEGLLERIAPSLAVRRRTDACEIGESNSVQLLLIAMASNLVGMASNPLEMASNLEAIGEEAECYTVTIQLRASGPSGRCAGCCTELSLG